MKKNRLLSGLLIAVLMVFSFGGAAFADNHMAETVVDIAVNTEGEFTILEAALAEAGLVETLQGEGPFTVFAPTDAAFGELLEDLGIEAEDLLAHPQLEAVLLYHVVAGKVMSGDLESGEVETVLGEMITIDAALFTINEDVEIVVEEGFYDLEAENGVVHTINKVLVPDVFELDYSEEDEDDVAALQSIVEIAQGNDDFSILVEALVAADLVSALEADGPFTVFAPTNDAFAALLEALDIEKDDLLEHPDLAAVLLYHVVDGAVFAEDLEEGMEPETLQGETLMISLEGGVFVNESEVIIPDIEASNGVIHAIDEVLVPEAFGAEEEVPETGDIGMIPFVIAGIAGASGLWIAKKRK